MPSCAYAHTGGYYWLWQNEHWFRTRDYRGGWVVAPGPRVPKALVKMPRGKYRHYRGQPARPQPGVIVGPPRGGVIVAPPPARGPDPDKRSKRDRYDDRGVVGPPGDEGDRKHDHKNGKGGQGRGGKRGD